MGESGGILPRQFTGHVFQAETRWRDPKPTESHFGTLMSDFGLKWPMKYEGKLNFPVGLRGMDLLDTPIWNKGTAFADHERAALGSARTPATARRVARGTVNASL